MTSSIILIMTVYDYDLGRTWDDIDDQNVSGGVVAPLIDGMDLLNAIRKIL